MNEIGPFSLACKKPKQLAKIAFQVKAPMIVFYQKQKSVDRNVDCDAQALQMPG